MDEAPCRYKWVGGCMGGHVATRDKSYLVINVILYLVIKVIKR